jgi:transcriptional regulator with XRE-family HTH domain
MRKPGPDLAPVLARRGRKYEGALLRSARLAAGLTQTELAERFGGRASDVSNMEANRIRTQPRVWIALGVNPETLPPAETPPMRVVRVLLYDEAADKLASWPEEARCSRLSALIEGA